MEITKFVNCFVFICYFLTNVPQIFETVHHHFKLFVTFSVLCLILSDVHLNSFWASIDSWFHMIKIISEFLLPGVLPIPWFSVKKGRVKMIIYSYRYGEHINHWVRSDWDLYFVVGCFMWNCVFLTTWNIELDVILIYI